MILQDLNSEITVENPDNKISLIFQSGVELSRTTLENQNIKYICAVFFNGKLKAMRSNQIDAIPNKQKNQSMITLAYNIFNLAPGDYEVQVRSEEHTSELQSRGHLVCRLLLGIKNNEYEYTY